MPLSASHECLSAVYSCPAVTAAAFTGLIKHSLSWWHGVKGHTFPAIAVCIKSILIQANTSLWTDATVWRLVLMNLGSYRCYNKHNIYNQNILKMWIGLYFCHSKEYNLRYKAIRCFSEYVLYVLEVQSKILSNSVFSCMFDWLIVCF